jgi:DNA topoisomerase-1
MVRLRRTSPDQPGWSRRRAGKGFVHLDETTASRKRAISGAMKEVASFLGNTPTLARSSYVDPRVIEAYEHGRTISRATSRTYDDPDERQAALERATLRLIKDS